jgi:hypothetical protein
MGAITTFLHRGSRNFLRHKTLMVMDYKAQERRLLTTEEREAKKAKAGWDAEQNMTARQKPNEAFRANFERLKAQWFARENNS